MVKQICDILRAFVLALLLSGGNNAYAYAEGQIMEKPVRITTVPGKFVFLSTLNPCEWGFSQFAGSGKEMFYLLDLEEPMGVSILTLGSDIYSTEIKVLGDNGYVSRMSTSREYQDILKENGRWDDASYFETQDCFVANLLPGTYRITVQGIKGGNSSATNGPVRVTVVGYDFFNLGHSLIAPDSIPGTRQCPFHIGRFVNGFTATVEKGKSEMPPSVSEMFFRLELTESMSLSFDYDDSDYEIALIHNNQSQVTVLRPVSSTDGAGIDFDAGSYLLWARFLPANENGILAFSVVGKTEELPERPEPPSPCDRATLGKNYLRTRTYLDASGADYRDEILYVDGLGRESRRVLAGGSPLGDDIVWNFGYDSSGRPERQWLPRLSQGGGYVRDADIDYSPYGDDAAPYSLTEYEPSTLGRIKKRYGPGEEWHSSGNAVAHSYETSTSTTGDLGCFRYVTASSGGGVAVRCTGRYGAGELLVERVTDEDGREGLTFTDGLGRKVLERRPMGDGTYADTYFVYDDRDNLAVVMPPEASARMAHTGMWQAASEELDLHCYIYSYDGFHRMTGMKLPGCGMRETVYDSADRPLLWRDGNLRAKGRWGFRITDMLGREVLTGTCASWSGHVGSLPVYASPERFPDPIASAPMPRAPSTLSLHGYDLYGITLTDPEVSTVSYYDDYGFIGAYGNPGSDRLGFVPSGYAGSEPYPSARGMLTGRLTGAPVSAGSDSLEYLASAFYYDHRERTVQRVSANRLGGYDRETTEYDFVGNPLRTELIHSTAADPSGIRQQWERSFDRQGRELAVRHRLGAGEWTVLSEKYYDAVGRLIGDIAGNDPKLVLREYTYDIRSRQTAISSATYCQRLTFTPGGNVSRMEWNPDYRSEPWSAYDFSYDSLSRLVAAGYSDSDGRSRAYDTSYSYDLDGNVTSLTRCGVSSMGISGEKYGIIDDLTYEYEGGRVVRITDSHDGPYYMGACHFVDGADEDEEYRYDDNGNMEMDRNRSIDAIIYDTNNRPRYIGFADRSNIRYIYDADGVKLRTEHVIQGIEPLTHVGGTSDGSYVSTSTDYCGQFVYEDGELERIHLGNGYLSYKDANGGRLRQPEYHFYHRDHLGNNRVDIGASDCSIRQIVHYYPFGLPMQMGYAPEAQRWKFGGKEFDRMAGLDLYDYEARLYDPVTLRFLRPDDHASTYHRLSPFSFCANNPLIITDPTGCRIEFVEGSTDTFISQFYEAYNYLKEYGASGVLDEIIGAEDFTIFIQESVKKESPIYESLTKTITWNPYLGLLCGEDGIMYFLSPAEILNHEAAHGLRDNIDKEGIDRDYQILDGQYRNKEERRVVETVETPTARNLNRLNREGSTRKSLYGTLTKVSTVRGDLEDVIDEY
ncbi:DUF6443 domain-containing protein [uncultured Muribaculum sp.]|uniref:DUF6443 domain-containing protein n=1 Tax=uncultured Muribaculum sp. TaxID=1918613 RepID=UPI0025DB2DE4|nr:DUF6443 domain-containing protein [uncultured Muribaculum sp.]